MKKRLRQRRRIRLQKRKRARSLPIYTGLPGFRVLRLQLNTFVDLIFKSIKGIMRSRDDSIQSMNNIESADDIFQFKKSMLSILEIILPTKFEIRSQDSITQFLKLIIESEDDTIQRTYSSIWSMNDLSEFMKLNIESIDDNIQVITNIIESNDLSAFIKLNIESIDDIIQFINSIESIHGVSQSMKFNIEPKDDIIQFINSIQSMNDISQSIKLNIQSQDDIIMFINSIQSMNDISQSMNDISQSMKSNIQSIYSHDPPGMKKRLRNPLQKRNQKRNQKRLQEYARSQLSTTYTELPKGSFRVLELQPGSGDEPLHATLHIEKFVHPESLPYDAISYAWGSKKNKAEMAIDGLWVRINRNLHWALTHTRDRETPMRIWADALCIDQRNNTEKNHQVAMMGETYRQAKTVFLCWGEPVGKCKDHEYIKGPHPTEPESIGTALDIMLGFQTSEWSDRLWVIQEAAVAKSPVVLYGPARFNYRPWLNILKSDDLLAAFYRGYPQLANSDWQKWPDQSSRIQKTSTTLEPLSVSDLLQRCCMTECSVPHDRIYALRSHPLFQQDARWVDTLQPDYGQRWERLYRNVAVKLLEIEGPQYLRCMGPEEVPTSLSDLLDVPTWVIQWHYMNRFIPIQLDARHRAGYADKSSDFRPDIRESTLSIIGKYIGRTTAVSNFEKKNERRRIVYRLPGTCHRGARGICKRRSDRNHSRHHLAFI